MKDAVILLMHQGNSFVQELAALLAARDLAFVAVSSRPADAAVFERNQAFLDAWQLADTTELRTEDVTVAARHFEQAGYRLRAAIATFEGYRLLMAELNATLGARDAPGAALALALDKFRCRTFLRDAGLSEVACEPIETGAGGPDLDPSRRWFVKPVRGAASFGCFILTHPDDLRDLPAIQAQMHNDGKLSSIFMGKFSFFAEEFVEGPEFSFEIAAAGRPRVVCVHEKARVERLQRTTLESMSISPPLCLPEAILQEGAAFVSECLSRIGLINGAYHVEMKYWEARRRWEIVEINPRMGGSLINASTERIIGVSMLELWLRSLLLRDEAELPAFHGFVDRVSQGGRAVAASSDRATVFVSKYGEKGRTVASIAYDAGGRTPDVLELHVKAGAKLENSDRAICVMDALWEVDRASLAQSVETIEKESDARFHITYQ
ncbi:ATP-grasp domain-containing protein [Trinickia caryophylli]|uniref:Biotin carboxylase n=1 Tax=Trinickia caryophylli TaxID=28094 RepID=A0A1X7GK92_TRICW|nr:ATP-grasp domain-containing protein [Trinickia caryophylli]PMS09883.1 ATP-grasp domain-containing protein [Trinickia caryophylli]TRX14919.1 ATP-grasp domain-containing protein [Trinickia caryophylli]WQE14771.1 ATP-grasp domain-containing protein [Trinickia caryophylli]SMF70328.1 Biotin carboxylase [Trinickia caryophylli]GLU34970.1 hypothetical protein Busp01_48120 [Trinickia caryophylli]